MISRESYKYDAYIEESYGARWAEADEIKETAFHIDLTKDNYKKAGIPVISDGENAYIDAEDTHSIIWGSTGSKKSRLFVFPLTNICIRAGESFVVMDPKGEIYKHSINSAREKGYNTIVLNLRDMGHGSQWNPLSEPFRLYMEGKYDESVNMVNDFVQILMGDRRAERDIFWPQMAANYITAHIFFLFALKNERVVNLGNVARLCSEDAVEQLKKLLVFMDRKSNVYLTYNVVLNTGEKTRTSITSYAYSMVSMYASQQLLSATLSKTSFSMSDIHKQKTAIYLIVPDEKDTYHFLASLFVKQLYEKLIHSAQGRKDGKIPVRMNFILDEFCNMPTIPDMVSMITAARSRNMRFYLFVQGMHQLKGKYGEDAETIKGNCENWFFLNSREYPLLNEISQLCGKRVCGGHEEPLISTSQLQHLNKEKGECLVFYRRNFPFVSCLADISNYQMFYNPCRERVYGKKFAAKYDVIDLNEIVSQKSMEARQMMRQKRNDEVEELIKKSRIMARRNAARRRAVDEYIDDEE